jgi:tRNA pseudouridine-54 N-methylase
LAESQLSRFLKGADVVTRRFLIVFDKLDIDTESVKSGHNSRNVVVACRCVNVGLFLSGDLRRDVEVSLLIGLSEDMKVITFPGLTLKRVSPDERSIAFFLLKAFNILTDMRMNSTTIMDNGIILHRLSLRELFNGWSVKDCYVANQEFTAESGFSGVSESGVFIYDLVGKNLGIEKYETKSLPRPKHPERFILEINLLCDSR